MMSRTRPWLATMVLLALLACGAPCARGSGQESGDLQLAKEILEVYYGRSMGEINKVVWFDFASSGQKNEFFVESTDIDPETGTEGPLLDVFSKMGPEWRNILHRDGRLGFDILETDTVMIDGTMYLLSGVRAGSGGFLNLSVYDYNGTESAREVYVEEGLYWGHFTVKNGRIYVLGGAQKFELRKGHKGFYLSHLKQDYTYDPAKGKHLLRFRDQNNSLLVTFDGRPVRFVETPREEGGYVPCYVTPEPICVRKSDTIVFDNNMNRPRANREFFEGAAWIIQTVGPDTTLIPRKEGEGEIRVDFDLARYYTLKFLIVK